MSRYTAYQLSDPTTDERDQVVYRLSSAYRHAAAGIAGEQMEKAGCRLAMVLNQALEQ